MKLIRINIFIFLTSILCSVSISAETDLTQADINQTLQKIRKDQVTPPKESLRKIDELIKTIKQKDLTISLYIAIALKAKVLTLAEQFNQASELIEDYLPKAEKLGLDDVITELNLSSLTIEVTRGRTKNVNNIRSKLLTKIQNEQNEQNEQQVAAIYMGLAYSFYVEKNYARALQYFQKAYELYLALNQHEEIALVLNDLGNIYLDLEDYDKAKKYYKETINIYAAKNNQYMESITLYNLGKAYLLNSEYSYAEKLFRQLVKLSSELEDEVGVQWAKSSLADVLFKEGELSKALAYYTECAQAFKEYNNKRMYFNCLVGVAETQIDLKQVDEAENAVNIIKLLSEELDDSFMTARYLKVSAKLSFAKSDYLNAYQAEKQYSNQTELIFKNAQKQNTQKYRIQFETDLQENKNKILLKDNQLKKLELEKQLQQKKYSDMIIFLALLIILIFSFMLYKQIQHRNRFKAMALQDHLTSSPNRRAILEYAKVQFEAAKYHQTELSIGIVDLDFFKKVNDTYGHDVGDEVLKSFANASKTVLRQEDKFGRYGGEEWLFVLPDASKANIENIFQRLRNEINSKSIKGFPSEQKITFSMGVAELNHTRDTSLHDLILRADECLYTAKNMGRDQVEMENV